MKKTPAAVKLSRTVRASASAYVGKSHYGYDQPSLALTFEALKPGALSAGELDKAFRAVVYRVAAMIEEEMPAILVRQFAAVEPPQHPNSRNGSWVLGLEGVEGCDDKAALAFLQGLADRING